MSSNAKPKVYVPRDATGWNYMSRRNIDILSHFGDPVVEPAGTGPIPEDVPTCVASPSAGTIAGTDQNVPPTCRWRV